MSTASEGVSTDHTPRTGQPPGALAILTATALGSIVAARLPKTPLMLAAGATALALLKQRKSAPAGPPRTNTPAPPEEVAPPPLEIPPQDKVQQWLHQQIHREAELEVVELPSQDTVSSPSEEEYTPPSFLLDDTEPIHSTISPSSDFARLTEPAPAAVTHKPDLPVLQALEATESCPTADSGWLLGIDPLPSIGESPSPPVFIAPVFEGAALPDEIEVPAPPEPVEHLMPVLTPLFFTASVEEVTAVASVPPPAVEPPETPVQEIHVQIAAPGEASFDPPLLDVPLNPWQPRPELEESPFAPITSHAPPPSTGSVIEAEIVLRPRAPTQTSVIAKPKPVSSRFAPAGSASSAPAAAGSDSPQPPAPSVSKREQRPRSTRNSWWSGE